MATVHTDIDEELIKATWMCSIVSEAGNGRTRSSIPKRYISLYDSFCGLTLRWHIQDIGSEMEFP
jgi:hypothetical protein